MVSQEWVDQVTRERDEIGELLVARSVSLVSAVRERDEARALADRNERGWDQAASLGAEREVELGRLRAALEPTVENVEALAQVLFVENWNYVGDDGPNEGPPLPWQDVIDEGSADGWRDAARAVYAAIRARAGLP